MAVKQLKFILLILFLQALTDTSSYDLCIDQSSVVTLKSSGNINFTRYNFQIYKTCELTLNGFEINSYVGLVGVKNCENTRNTKVYINTQTFCATNDTRDYKFIHLPGGTFRVVVNETREYDNFVIRYYGNIAECGQTVRFLNDSATNQLHGLMTKSIHSPSSQKLKCLINIVLSESYNIVVRFRIFSISSEVVIQIGAKKFPESSSPGDELFVSARNGTVTLKIDAIFYPSFSFVLGYTLVPHCGKLPEISNAIFATRYGEGVVGSTAPYRCTEGFQLADTFSGVIVCSKGESIFTPFWDNIQNCTTVICKVPKEYRKLKSVDFNLVKDVYKYGQYLPYRCYLLHSQVNLVRCRKTGKWSATPACEVSIGVVTLVISVLILTLTLIFALCIRQREKGKQKQQASLRRLSKLKAESEKRKTGVNLQPTPGWMKTIPELASHYYLYTDYDNDPKSIYAKKMMPRQS